MDFARTKLSIRRSPLSYAKVQAVVGAIIRNRAWLQRKPAGEYLDVGCGPNPSPGFINLDRSWRPDIDLCWDIAEPLPLASKSLLGIFTEHCLEHVPLTVCDFALGEFRRVLQPGGVLRIVVPDGELYLRGYSAGHELPYGRGEMSPMFSVNRVFREHGHQFIYDFAMLNEMLRRHGFVRIRKLAFQQGTSFLLRDTEFRAVESLYIEAAAPGITPDEGPPRG